MLDGQYLWWISKMWTENGLFTLGTPAQFGDSTEEVH